MSKRLQPGSVYRGVLIATGLSLGLSLAGAAQAQLKPGSQSGLGLTGAHIPQILQQDRADPYRMPAEPICASIDQEMAQLDAVMGPEVDKLKTDRSIADRAAGYVRGMIPYHGVVRFLTGADSKDRELQAAASAGYARRGFLHGLKAQNHCAGGDVRVVSASPTAPVAATPVEVPLATVQAPSVEAQGVEASARVAEPAARLQPVAAVERTPPVGERLGAQMPRDQVVYQLVDATTGHAIVPDQPAADPGGR
ncbi:MAG: hypothetical protein JSR98_17420 [Proteobacteria bacterium]|nr:hypothetical protein [Pseudomonadota bacterium]